MKKSKILAIIVTILLFIIILYKIDLVQTINTLKNFNWKNMWLIVPLYILTLYIRGIRWKALLLNDKKYTSLNLAEVFTAGSMLNSFLPARAGDLYRAYYLGSVKGESKMKIFGSVILERILDGVSMFFILLAAVIVYCKTPWILNFTYIIGVLFVGSLIAFYLIVKFNKIDCIVQFFVEIFSKFSKKHSEILVNIAKKSGEFIKSFIQGFEALKNLKCFATALISSFIIWGIEAYVAFLIVDSFNLNLGISAGLFVISFVSFSTVIPSASVFLGPYQYAYILALSIFYIPKSVALAISAVHQAILMVILAIIGGICLLKFDISLKDVENKKN